MTEILNRDEIDSLLAEITSGALETAACPEKNMKKIKTCDFRRPDKFAGDHIRTLRMIHETFARLTSAMLSARLRAPVSVYVVSLDQLTYEEFLRSIPCPATLGLLDMIPLSGPAVLEIDPGLSFTMIDRLFGGHGRAVDFSRELTDIELYAMERILSGITENLISAWSNVVKLKPVLSGIETNPQFAQVVPPDDIVILITFEVKIGDIEGLFNLCIPYITLEPVIEKLSSEYWYSSQNEEKNAVMTAHLEKTVYKRHIFYTDAAGYMLSEMIRKLKPGMNIPLKADAYARAGYEFSRTGKEV